MMPNQRISASPLHGPIHLALYFPASEMLV